MMTAIGTGAGFVLGSLGYLFGLFGMEPIGVFQVSLIGLCVGYLADRFHEVL